MTSRISPRGRRLRLLGLAVLVIGIAAAICVYRIGIGSPDLMSDPTMAGFNKARERQMGELYGNMGALDDQLIDELRKPATQAKLIAVASILVAAGCYYVSRLLDRAGESIEVSGICEAPPQHRD